MAKLRRLRRFAQKIQYKLGKTDSEKTITLSEKQWGTHSIITGATGSGKTYQLLSLMQQQLKRREGFTVIDQHGDITAYLKKYITQNRRWLKPEKIHIIDVGDENYTFAMNAFHTKSPDHIPAMADGFASAISTIYDSGDPNATPLIKSVLHAIATMFGELKLTLNEARYLLFYAEKEVRSQFVQQLTNTYYRSLMADWNEARRQEYVVTYEAVERRLRSFLSHPLVEEIFGQDQDTIDMERVLDDGEVVMFNLSSVGGILPIETARTIGLLYVNSLVRAARERNPLEHNTHHTLYIDECQNYLSYDCARILDELRKYSLSLVMACQTMEQIRLKDERVYASVRSNARTKIAFAEDNYEEAARLALELYADQISPDRVKEILSKPVVVGHRKIKLRSESTARANGTQRMLSETEAVTDMRSRTRANGFATGEGSAEGSATTDVTTNVSSLSQTVFIPDANAVMTIGSPTDGMHESVGSGTTSQSGKQASEVNSKFYSTSGSEADSRGVANLKGVVNGSGDNKTHTSTMGYSETLEPVLEILPSATYSLDEQTHVFAVGIMKQKRGEATVKLPQQKAVKITTPYLKDPVASPSVLSSVMQTYKETTPFLVPRALARKRIKERTITIVANDNDDFTPVVETKFLKK